MADPFNEAIRTEQEMAERDFRLYLRADQAGRSLPDFDKEHAKLRRLGRKLGKTKRGAQAWATLQILEIKRIVDAQD